MNRLKKRIVAFVVGLCSVITISVGIVKFQSVPHFNLSNTGGYIHVSIDDSNSIFEDLTLHENEYDSIFDNPILNFIQQLHKEYGATFSFYVFYSWNIDEGSFCLADATDKFAEEFSTNSSWLRFGFHAKDATAYETINSTDEAEWYSKTITELVRITGSTDCIDNFVRLDRFYADREMVEAISEQENGVVGLLCADDPNRDSYDLTKNQMKLLNELDWLIGDNGVYYTPTDIRIENLGGNDDFYSTIATVESQDIVTVFTHEWKLDDDAVRKYMIWICQYAVKAERQFVFLEDII